jgi:glutamyl-Q tRNA(Asp) synthetase
MEEVDRTVSHMKDEAANFPDPADRATQEEEFSLELRTRDRERKLIKKIDSTIERIEQDDYGFCDACGVEIGIKRLEARPDRDAVHRLQDPRRDQGKAGAGLSAPPRGRPRGRASPYRGRFAPSPSGPLHFGSLLAALGSYLDARAAGGRWLLRIEDIDPPREVPGAADSILRSLEAHGLHWDGSVLYQSTRSEAYDEALGQLQSRAGCSAAPAPARCWGPAGAAASAAPRPGRALLHARAPSRRARLRRSGARVTASACRCPRTWCSARKDGLYAYTLAVVVDDGWQGITHVIRGRDLLEQTPPQCALLEYLAHRLRATATSRCSPTPMATSSASRPAQRRSTTRAHWTICA